MDLSLDAMDEGAREDVRPAPDLSGATPMMAQYLAIKAENPEGLLFYRMGDFYELFFEDAEVAAKALAIHCTTRGTHRGEPIKMAGVPVHAAEEYLARLIAKNFRVVIAEQVEDPAEAKKRGAKSVVARAVVRIVTPGTLTEERLARSRGREKNGNTCASPNRADQKKHRSGRRGEADPARERRPTGFAELARLDPWSFSPRRRNLPLSEARDVTAAAAVARAEDRRAGLGRGLAGTFPLRRLPDAERRRARARELPCANAEGNAPPLDRRGKTPRRRDGDRLPHRWRASNHRDPTSP